MVYEKQLKLQHFPELTDFCNHLEYNQLIIEKHFYDLAGGNGDFFYMEPDEINKKIKELQDKIKNKNILGRI